MSIGLKNLDQIIDNSHRIGELLEGLSLDDERKALSALEDQLADLKDKFFMNTVAAVPATKACLVGSEKVLSALEDHSSDPEDSLPAAVKQALDELSEAAEELIDKAEMRGTTLT